MILEKPSDRRWGVSTSIDLIGVLSLIPMHIVSESSTSTSPPSILRLGNSSWKNMHLLSLCIVLFPEAVPIYYGIKDRVCLRVMGL